jgi:hypothetical protein
MVTWLGHETGTRLPDDACRVARSRGDDRAGTGHCGFEPLNCSEIVDVHDDEAVETEFRRQPLVSARDRPHRSGSWENR